MPRHIFGTGIELWNGMKNYFALIFLVFSHAFASSTMYLSADTSKWRPDVQLTSPFDHQKMTLSVRTTQPITAYTSDMQSYTLPNQTQLLIDTTLDQIYNSFKNPLQSETLFSRDSQRELMGPVDPMQLQLQFIIKELIDIKQAEYASDLTSRGRPSKAKDELVKVRVEKEGKLEEALVDLKKAHEQGAIEVEEEALDTRVPGDFDGTEKWAPPKKNETTDFLKCFTCHLDNRIPGTLKQTERMGDSIQTMTVNQAIMKKYAAYSMDPKTGALVNLIKKNVKSPSVYKDSVKQCYKYVKNALVDAKLLDSRPDGINPRFAGDKLKAAGFENLMEHPDFKGLITDPSQAPKGAILVYEPTNPTRLVTNCDREKANQPKRCIQRPDIFGHIEVKTDVVGKPGFASDYYSEKARTGNALESADRRLIGIYVKKQN